MLKYNKPRLIELVELRATEGGGCQNGSVNVETCVAGTNVIPSCGVGGIPTAERP